MTIYYVTFDFMGFTRFDPPLETTVQQNMVEFTVTHIYQSFDILKQSAELRLLSCYVETGNQRRTSEKEQTFTGKTFF